MCSWSCDRSCSDSSSVSDCGSAVEGRQQQRSANAEVAVIATTRFRTAPCAAGRGVGCARYISPPIVSERKEHLRTGRRRRVADWAAYSRTAWSACSRASSLGMHGHRPSSLPHIAEEDCGGKEWGEGWGERVWLVGCSELGGDRGKGGRLPE
eukprot:scaffold56535_cov29-Tisochrysis_lutea.AAC.2